MSEIERFQQEYPSLDSYWRAVILFGRNVATYKFALGKALLTLADEGKTQVSAEELSIPYAAALCEHLKLEDKQITSRSSSFLNACRQFNSSEISQDQLIQVTAAKGFANVLDAFHVVNGIEIPERFFHKRSTSNSSGIILTDNVFKLRETVNSQNFDAEIEARWRLVETAWSLNIPANLLTVEYDSELNTLITHDSSLCRKDITSVRAALNGYQKGKCFYCFGDIDASDDSGNCDVDHFFPHALQPYTNDNLDGVWNLVLSCPHCNRGANGKFAKIPEHKYLERLNKRNNFLVNSHHPLRETIMRQTGFTDQERTAFLRRQDTWAISLMIHRWHPEYENAPVF